MTTLSAIPIMEPWIDMILIEVKTWEIRSKNTLKIGPVALFAPDLGQLLVRQIFLKLSCLAESYAKIMQEKWE